MNAFSFVLRTKLNPFLFSSAPALKDDHGTEDDAEVSISKRGLAEL